jgi:hypothetical protein
MMSPLQNRMGESIGGFARERHPAGLMGAGRLAAQDSSLGDQAGDHGLAHTRAAVIRDDEGAGVSVEGGATVVVEVALPGGEPQFHEDIGTGVGGSYEAVWGESSEADGLVES